MLLSLCPPKKALRTPRPKRNNLLLVSTLDGQVGDSRSTIRRHAMQNVFTMRTMLILVLAIKDVTSKLKTCLELQLNHSFDAKIDAKLRCKI